MASYIPEEKLELTKEDIARHKAILNSAEPYTDEEINAIPYDSFDFDLNRYSAWNSQNILRDAGIID